MRGHGRRVCRYCYETGHNVRTCPKVQADKHTSYRAERLNARAEQTRLDARIKGRKCSYCQEPGHNLQTCETKKADRSRLVKANRIERERFVAWCKQEGFGIGSLVHKDGKIGMIIAFEPEYINCQSHKYGNRPVGVKFPKEAISFLSLPKEFINGNPNVINASFDSYRMVSKTSKSLPFAHNYDWISGNEGVDKLLPNHHFSMPI